ncbi:hypothetical protein SAMN05444380_10197 [Thermophagus xiamenensis]|uniref:Uncharacterized protein n=1 Tax=Thermophagus xiamenensis TaxID=385682 RepID=A0A1I1UIR9_9BACT|nr:hypothetical protein SAMN05444380_10197 [Thermophagus xiamenensis]
MPTITIGDIEKSTQTLDEINNKLKENYASQYIGL